MSGFRENLLSQLSDRAPNIELWWDSLPSRYQYWHQSVLPRIHEIQKRHETDSWLCKFIDFKNMENSLLGGCTTNPRLVLETINEDSIFWGKIIKSIDSKKMSSDTRYWNLYKKIFEINAKLLMPLWEQSNGRHGWVCAQVPPNLSYRDEEIVIHGLDLHRISPNVMIKVVGSEHGYRAIKELVSKGIAINNTLSFSVPQHISCIKSITDGYSDALENGIDMSRWRSVITLMIGRIGASEEFKYQAEQRNFPLDTYKIRLAELAVFYKVNSLIQKAKVPIETLVCSLKIDNIWDEKRCIHLEGIIGSDSIVTLPPAFMENILTSDTADIKWGEISKHKVTIDNITPDLLNIPYFSQIYEENGMAKTDFFYHPVFLEGLSEVNSAYRKTVEFIENCSL